MFCTTNLVIITWQNSASQFSGATHMHWLTHGGTRADHTLAQFYSSSHTLFSMQRKTKQKMERSGAPCYIPRGPQHNPLGSTCLIKRKAFGATHATVSPSSFLSFHFLSVMPWHSPVTNSLLLYWKRAIGQARFTCLKAQALQVSARVEDGFGPTSWRFI